MNKIFMLAKGNIRKAKGQMLILATLFLIAATLLIMGLSVMLGFGSHFDALVEELNASEGHFNMARSFFNDEVEALFREESTQFEAHLGIQFPNAEITWEDDMRTTGIIFYSMSDTRYLSQWKLVGDALPLTHDSIYVPFLYHFAAGYSLGDTLTVLFDGYSLDFIIAGFVENIWAESLGLTPRAYIPQSRFNELYEMFPRRVGMHIYVNGLTNIFDFATRLIPLTPLEDMGFNPYYWISGIPLSQVISGRTGTAVMMSTLMVAFTIIIGVVSVLVIRFRIKNSIEEDMPKIGSLMSIGYTSRQIKASIVAQYSAIVLGAALVSILPAVLLLPQVGRIFGELSGIHWQPGFMPIPIIVTVVSLTALVYVFTSLSARGIKKITPVLALRGGIKTHSFKRNPLPLHKSFLPINASLAFKSVFQGLRQSTMMLVILLAVSFTAVVSLVVFYNAAVDLSAFEQIPGIERHSAAIAFSVSEEESVAIQQEIDAHPDVRVTQFFSQRTSTISGMFTTLFVMENYDLRATQNVFRGIFPRYANEVAITWLLAEEKGITVGDQIHIGEGNVPFLVTGLLSGFEVGEFGAYLTFGGIHRIYPNTERTLLGIYLNPRVDAAEFVAEMETRFSDYAFMFVDMDEQFAHGVAGFAGVMSLVGVIIIVISAFIVVLVLYFVIGSTIVRKHRDLGIQKAIGFTTGNLMNQISLAFSLPIVFGTAAGTALGALLVDPIMSWGLRPMGVMQANLIINMPWAVAAGAVIIVLAYVISMLTTWRIRKISAYKLVTE